MPFKLKSVLRKTVVHIRVDERLIKTLLCSNELLVNTLSVKHVPDS